MYCVQDPTFKIWLVVLCTTIEMIQSDWLEITDLEKLMIEISLPDNVWIILVYNTILYCLVQSSVTVSTALPSFHVHVQYSAY